MLQDFINIFKTGGGTSGFLLFLKKYFVNPFASIMVWDILDILVMAALFYWIYRFIRQRRAGKLAIGLVLLFALSLIGSVLQMRAVNSLLGNIYQVGIIAIVIIFQPELRDALEKMGNTPSSIRNIGSAQKVPGPVANMVSILSEVCSTMSKELTGALIVIERGTKLGDFIDSGVHLDADMSVDLIRNIFFNKSPLHDGAIIISNYRIAAAGCILPSSRSEDNFKEMGTRHRAAVGISEVSDAVVLVVSEETGQISIANNGIIKRNYNSGSLKEDLLLLLAGVSADADYSQGPDMSGVPAEMTEEEGKNDENV